ncbi:MAG: glycosyltransferase [Planctomycetota bacterium]
MEQVRIMELRGTYKGGGGPDKTILLSAERHNKTRFFVLVTYLRQPDDSEFQIGKMVANKDIDYVEVIDRRLIDIKCILELKSLISKHKIDIIHTHDEKSLLYGILLKILKPKVKILYTCHLHKIYTVRDTGGYIGFIKSWVRRKITINIMKFYPPPILAVSDATKKLLVKDGIKKSKIDVLLNSIDYNFWEKEPYLSTFRKELNIGAETFVIGLIGRLGYDKDLPTFLKVARKTLLHYPDTIFVLVGEGRTNEMDMLKRQCVEDGMDKSVIFTGFRSDLKNIYSALDLFLMTSTAEGLPNTVLEAMSMGVPVVSTSVDGVPELVIDGKTGYLCRIGAVDNLTEKVKVLIENNELRECFSKASRERIKVEFSFDKRLRLIEEYYTTLHSNDHKG